MAAYLLKKNLLGLLNNAVHIRNWHGKQCNFFHPIPEAVLFAVGDWQGRSRGTVVNSKNSILGFPNQIQMSITFFIACEMYFNSFEMLYSHHNKLAVVPHDFQHALSWIELDNYFVMRWKSCVRNEFLITMQINKHYLSAVVTNRGGGFGKPCNMFVMGLSLQWTVPS